MVNQSTKRKLYGTPNKLLKLPPLIEIQSASFNWFLDEGITEVSNELSPIEDFTGKHYSLTFGKHSLEASKFTPDKALEKGVSYDAKLKVKTQLLNKETGEILEQEVFLGDLPLMTDKGTFIINGNERVIVSQIARSPGVFYARNYDKNVGKNFASAALRPSRGAWMSLETNKNNILTVKIDRRRKISVTALLRAFGLQSDSEIISRFADVDTNSERPFIQSALAKDPSKTQDEALIEIYSKMRPGEPAVLDNARSYFDSLFNDARRYSLGRVGRYKLNQRLGLNKKNEEKTWLLDLDDIVMMVKILIQLNNGVGEEDDIDHLANRRIRAVGELLQNTFRVGMLRLERIARERMSLADEETALVPITLINARPIVAVMNEFFGSSRLSQFMSQTNPLDQIEHLRRVSVYGPGGLTRERAGFSVRDVHSSYYGRLCVIKAPEGPNVGLLSALATYTRINEFGFLEAPYRKVEHKDGRSYATDQVVYLMADIEEQYRIAEATIGVKEDGEITDSRVAVRYQGHFVTEDVHKLDYLDVVPAQMLSVSSALIPFVSSDAGKFPLMGSNMQNQAVPLLEPRAPLVGTNMEDDVLVHSGQLIHAEEDGAVDYVDSLSIIIKSSKGKKHTYLLKKFERTNQNTCYNQRPLVNVGDKVKVGDLLAHGASSEKGELALGRDLLAAFMPWEGFNFDDSVVISERLVYEDLLSSIHIQEYEAAIMDTKLGPEEVTRDIPNVSEEILQNLAEDGVVYIGAEVSPGDILVGKIAPKGETELTAEERLLRAIFGEKAREVRDTSLRMAHGDRGTVIGITILSRESKDELPPGVIKLIKVRVAQKRKVMVGDKISGRHGSKGIVAKALPVADMPFLEDGTPVDVVLNPLSIIARMNVGQILETHLGWAARVLKRRYAVPAYDRYKTSFIIDELKEAHLPETGKVTLFDGRTGEAFDQPVTVGFAYIMKLIHLVEDKVHARSTGPYSLITQQPLGGKAQMGGQRLGEMEVWALEAYGAAYTLQEMLTIKSDDVVGRAKAFEAIVRGAEIPEARTPASFKVLVRELNGLCLHIETLNISGQVTDSDPLTQDQAHDREIIPAADDLSSAKDKPEQADTVTEDTSQDDTLKSIEDVKTQDKESA